MKKSNIENEISRDFIHLSQLANTPKTNFRPLLENILTKCIDSSDYKEIALFNLVSMAIDHSELKDMLKEISLKNKSAEQNTIRSIVEQVLMKVTAAPEVNPSRSYRK
jgi:hypothetical protein